LTLKNILLYFVIEKHFFVFLSLLKEVVKKMPAKKKAAKKKPAKKKKC